MTRWQKAGNIIIPGGLNQPEPHEYATANVFARSGMDVEFIKPSRLKGSRTPDVKIGGIMWEMKSPMGKSKKTVANALRRAIKQSGNVIIDAHLLKLSDEEVEKELLRNVPLTRSLKRLKLITKTDRIIDIK